MPPQPRRPQRPVPRDPRRRPIPATRPQQPPTPAPSQGTPLQASAPQAPGLQRLQAGAIDADWLTALLEFIRWVIEQLQARQPHNAAAGMLEVNQEHADSCCECLVQSLEAVQAAMVCYLECCPAPEGADRE